MLARGGAASGTAGPASCTASVKIVTENQVLGNLNRLKKHMLSKLGIGTNKKRKHLKEGGILEAEEGCEKGLVRSRRIPDRSIPDRSLSDRSLSKGSAVLFLSGLLGDAVQGVVSVCTVVFHCSYRVSGARAEPAASLPRAAVLPGSAISKVGRVQTLYFKSTSYAG